MIETLLAFLVLENIVLFKEQMQIIYQLEYYANQLEYYANVFSQLGILLIVLEIIFLLKNILK